MLPISKALWEITIINLEDEKYFWEAHTNDSIGISHEQTAKGTYKHKANCINNAKKFISINNIVHYTITEE